MKNKKIRLIALIALLSMLVAVFAGCGGNNAQKEKQLDELKSGVTDDKNELANLTFYFPGDSNPNVQAGIDEIQKRAASSLNIKLNFKWVPSYNYKNEMMKILASNEQCDAMLYPTDNSLNLMEMIQKGMLKDITESFPKAAPNLYKKYSQEDINAVKTDKKIWAVPSLVPINARTNVIVRKDFMDKYQIPDIKTFEDYEAYMKIIKEKEPEIVPASNVTFTLGAFADSLGYIILEPRLGLVYKSDDPQMKIKPWEQTEDYKKVIETICRWRNSGYTLQNSTDQGSSDSAMLLGTGKVSSCLSDLASFEYINAKVKMMNPEIELKEYQLYPERMSQRFSPLGNGFVFNAKSQNVDRVLKFLQWVQESQDNYDLVIYGIKGQHYELEGDKYALPKDFKPTNALYYGWNGQSGFYSVQYYRSMVTDPEGYKENLLASLKNNSKYSPTVGFHPDLTPVSNEVDQRYMHSSDVDRNLYLGTFLPEDVDEFIKTQKEAGIDKVVVEIQKQLDAWKTSEK